MQIKAVALDLDGTLLKDNKTISNINKEVLRDLTKKGVKIFLATGRSYMAAKKYAYELGLGDTIITYNGAKVVDFVNDIVMYEMPLQPEYTKKILKMAKDKNIHVNLYQDEVWYVEDASTRESIHYGENASIIPVEKDFDTFDSYEMTKMTMLDLDESEAFTTFCKEVSSRFGREVYTALSQDFLFEVANKNINKGIVLRKVLRANGIDPQECVAFGDALNDLEMLTEVGYGVAMGNAPMNLKRKVRFVTDTNENNGVAKFLKKYFY